jgi:hypothetical protein
MDGDHLLAAFRYIAFNPVRAGLVSRPADWRWSSTTALLAGKTDGITATKDVLHCTGNFSKFLDGEADLAARPTSKRLIGLIDIERLVVLFSEAVGAHRGAPSS